MRQPNRPIMLPAITLAAGALLVAGCGGDDSPSPSGEAATPASAKSDFPKAEGSIDEFVSSVGETNEVVASPSEGVFVPGQNRLGFGLFDVSGPPIDDADVAVYAQDGPDGELQGPFPARVESLEVQSPYKAESADDDDADHVYVADVPFDNEGEYRAVAVIRDSDGSFEATNFVTSLVVQDQPKIPDVGDPAPKIDTPTVSDVSDVSEIDTRVPPSTMHSDDLADVLGKEPVVLLFATPRLCQVRVCGPVVDVAEQVKAEYGDEAAFIHMEIYKDNVFDPENLRPQVTAFGLPTEPWLFVIDKDGNVSTRIEGAFSVTELEQALDKVVAPA